MSLPFERPSSVRSIPARYPGTCDECGAGFEEGDPIAYNAANELVHADPEECELNAKPVRAVEPCEKCFLVHAGDCF